MKLFSTVMIVLETFLCVFYINEIINKGHNIEDYLYLCLNILGFFLWVGIRNKTK